MIYRLKPKEVRAFPITETIQPGSWLVILGGNLSIFNHEEFRDQFEAVNGQPEKKTPVRPKKQQARASSPLLHYEQILGLIRHRAMTTREIIEALPEIGKQNIYQAVYSLKKSARILYDEDRATYRLARIKENNGK